MLKPSLTLSSKALVLVAVPLACELVFVLFLVSMLHEIESNRRYEVHARDVAWHTTNITRMLLVKTFFDTIVAALPNQGDPDSPDPVLMAHEMAVLKDTVKANPKEAEPVARMEKLTRDCLKILDEAAIAVRNDDDFGKLKCFTRLLVNLDRLFLTSDQLLREQRTVAAARADAQGEEKQKVESLLALAVPANVLLVILLALYFNKSTARRFAILKDNAVRLGARQPLNPPLQGDDEIAKLDSFFQEMSRELVEATRRERAAIDNARDVIFSLDQNSRFTEVSPAALASWGYSPDELLGARLMTILHPKDASRVTKTIEELMRGECHQIFECSIKKKPTGTVECSWSTSFSPSEKTLFCVAHDMTEHKQIERLKNDFVAMVSHDLRTPLASIDAFLSLLSERVYGELSPPGPELLALAEERITELTALINNLLHLEKMESGMLPMHLAKTSVGAVMESAIESVSECALKRGVVLKPWQGSDGEIHVDSDWMVRAISILLTKSIEYATAGAAVEVSIEPAPHSVKIEISGCGRVLAAREREILFDRFAQTESLTDINKCIDTLALAICKGVIEQHHGTFGVDALSGTVAEGANSGTRFWLSIPQPEEEGS